MIINFSALVNWLTRLACSRGTNCRLYIKRFQLFHIGYIAKTFMYQPRYNHIKIRSKQKRFIKKNSILIFVDSFLLKYQKHHIYLYINLFYPLSHFNFFFFRYIEG